jgi:hypothetical protein
MVARTHWLTANIDGLAQLLGDRPKSSLMFELIQNSLDAGAPNITVTLKPVSRGVVRVEVIDDSAAGIENMDDLSTLFAPSNKKGDPTLRGRFNVGEKYFLSLCKWAEIVSMSGHVSFDPDGERRKGRKRTEVGTRVTADMSMTLEELAEVERSMTRLLTPQGVNVSVNGSIMAPRVPIVSFQASLVTVIADHEGVPRRRPRTTEVRVYEPREGEVPTVYEMGIPVVETQADRFHIDILQKVPLTPDRDSLSPAFLRDLRVEVLNATHSQLSEDAVRAAWVTDAMTDERVALEAIVHVMDERFGPLRATYDMRDREANTRAAASGYEVLHGSAFPRAAWDNIKAAGAIEPAGRIFPTPRGIGGGSIYGTLPPAVVTDVPYESWSLDMRAVVGMSLKLLEGVLGHAVTARIVTCVPNDRSALDYNCSKQELRFNFSTLTADWFRPSNLARQLDAVIHEGSHDRVSDHMTETWYKECTRIGGLVGAYIHENPSVCRSVRALASTNFVHIAQSPHCDRRSQV